MIISLQGFCPAMESAFAEFLRDESGKVKQTQTSITFVWYNPYPWMPLMEQGSTILVTNIGGPESLFVKQVAFWPIFSWPLTQFQVMHQTR